MMEKRNIIEPGRTPKSEIKSPKDDLIKTAEILNIKVKPKKPKKKKLPPPTEF